MDVGATLRHAREEKGLTLDRLSHVTRVSVPILTAIERNDRRAIPPRPYGRGFVKLYASEVGLKPDAVVREYFSQFAPAPEPHTEPEPRDVILDESRSRQSRRIAVAVACVLVLAFVLFAARTLQQDRPADTVASVGRETPAPAATTGAIGPAAGSAPSAWGITIALTATAPSWVRAEVDGRRVIYRIMQPGEQETLRGKREIVIRTGDAGAVRWQINSGPAAPMGKPGEVRTARVTPEDRKPPA